MIRFKWILLMTLLCSILFLECGGGKNCDEQLKEFYEESYFFTVQKKYMDGRAHIIEGIDTNKKSIRFINGFAFGLYDSTVIGDILKKDSGTTDVTLTRNSKTRKFSYGCN
jgi:hypothetical protein